MVCTLSQGVCAKRLERSLIWTVAVRVRVAIRSLLSGRSRRLNVVMVSYAKVRNWPVVLARYLVN